MLSVVLLRNLWRLVSKGVLNESFVFGCNSEEFYDVYFGNNDDGLLFDSKVVFIKWFYCFSSFFVGFDIVSFDEGDEFGDVDLSDLEYCMVLFVLWLLLIFSKFGNRNLFGIVFILLEELFFKVLGFSLVKMIGMEMYSSYNLVEKENFVFKVGVVWFGKVGLYMFMLLGGLSNCVSVMCKVVMI